MAVKTSRLELLDPVYIVTCDNSLYSDILIILTKFCKEDYTMMNDVLTLILDKLIVSIYFLLNH